MQLGAISVTLILEVELAWIWSPGRRCDGLWDPCEDVRARSCHHIMTAGTST